MKRKNPLLKNEIEMIQIVLRNEGFPTEEYRLKLANNLEQLKREWYKVKQSEKKEWTQQCLKDYGLYVLGL